ncbi:alpha/beta fold hydrolase [Azospirillum cavernae]|uniref:Alpha/beta fold hydrolase n=1 Tax=Azospirillum cavernae TaxID=2320860 RepID=A0A418W3J8_9PROT|nr:alpha/beta fold hydrolase [Azospirillum cavernae]RJF84514.1 alpha/beta fold hydrolase [Azospirillum cavernae]
MEYLETVIDFDSFDGVHLQGTFCHSKQSARKGMIVLLVHGVQTDRHETGFYSRMAYRFAEAGLDSFRFDWRCHGVDSERPISTLTLTSVRNDITAAYDAASMVRGMRCPAVIVAASFSGGVAVRWAFRHTAAASVVLLNPVLDYLDEYIIGPQKGDASSLNKGSIDELEALGTVTSQRKGFGRPAINEFRDYEVIPKQNIPHWIFHGDKDTGVDIKTSRIFSRIYENIELCEIAGAEHGFVEPGDWRMETAETLRRHADLYEVILEKLERSVS